MLRMERELLSRAAALFASEVFFGSRLPNLSRSHDPSFDFCREGGMRIANDEINPRIELDLLNSERFVPSSAHPTAYSRCRMPYDPGRPGIRLETPAHDAVV